MPRPKKPAAVTQGHNESKSDLIARQEDEKQLAGADDELRTVPQTIASDDLAVEYYHEVVSLLEDSGILSNLDRYGVGAIADCLSKIQQSNEIINTEGHIITQITKAGDKDVVNPAYTIHDKYLNHFNKLCTQYGLSPSSRAQLSSMTLEMRAEANDELAGILNSGE